MFVAIFHQNYKEKPRNNISELADNLENFMNIEMKKHSATRGNIGLRHLTGLTHHWCIPPQKEVHTNEC